MPGFELIGEEEKQGVIDIFNKGGVLYRYALNDRRQNIFRVDDFEKEIAKKVGVNHALCVCNGTAALKLSLFALGIRAGDEVITQSFTFIATVEAILELGAIPVITDIDRSLNMDPSSLEKKITKKTKAIIPVHMAGVAAKMDEIITIAEKYNLPILEDSAQALGATYKGQCLGTIGKVGIYSLDIGKIITTGEGGVVVTNDKDIFLKAREYSDHGHEQNPNVPRGEDTRRHWGFNYKTTELHGAIGLAQLKKLDFILNKQKANKMYIKKGISDIKGIEFREIPNPDGDASDCLIFFLDSKDRATAFAKKLSSQGIGTKNLPDAINWHYAGTWSHIFNNYPDLKGKNLDEVWSQSSGYLRRAIALPIMVNMTEETLEHIIETVKAVAREVY
ncbi:MAG: DegT/DnrJ/EryC1/StrS family aminotransferase [bacterium]